ncbi:MAG TPA: heavy metal translocating P-type ATPase [Dissulfurispiraceae bacterium]|nr:heavy metal translocating P-type ATPase [Dissulfurispiraceae bacterium]
MKCDHCLLEFPARDAVEHECDGKRHAFCCHGCLGVYRLIHEEGLERFYENRQWKEKGIASVLQTGEINLRSFHEHVHETEGRNEIDIYIDGIRCASCVWLNERILTRTPGVVHARINYATHRAKIRWNPAEVGLKTILERIRAVGYSPKPYSESEGIKAQQAESRDLLIRFGTAGFLSSQLMIYSIALYAGYFQGIDAPTKRLLEIIALFLTLPVIFYAGMPFLRASFTGLRHLRFPMDVLITLGALSAFFYSIYQMFVGGEVYFDTAAMIITIILLGRYIEAVSKGKASETIQHLRELSPREARLIAPDDSDAEERRMTSLDAVKRGDLIEVIPGERVPLDGVVIRGRSEVDESLITGESRPVMKEAGADVIGGSMNLYGQLVFEVMRTGHDTVLAGIIRAVEDAQAQKPRIQTLADKVVGIFVPVILLIALMTAGYYYFTGEPLRSALMTGISVLVIACPCSLGLATPLAVLLITSVASSRGVLVRNGQVIENLSRITDVVFDKTGTVTEGRPALREIILLDPSWERSKALAAAAAVEALSEHSVGRAITSAARSLQEALPQVLPSTFKAVPGRGVEAVVDGSEIVVGNQAFMEEKGFRFPAGCSAADEIDTMQSSGETVVFMGRNKTVGALFAITDVPRSEMPNVIAALREFSCSPSIVSGDNVGTTRALAFAIGIDHFIAEALPAQKRNIVMEMQAEGKRVMMVGDGINDAPALTEASVGVAMGRATEIAMESANVVLVRNDLLLLPFLLKLSRRGFAIIRQNIFWAFFYNICAVPLAVAGLLHPIVAAAAMAASSLFVVGNSMRIGRMRKG